jgi:hypothetical protein
VEVRPGQFGRVRACRLVNAESDVRSEARVRFEETPEKRVLLFWHGVSSKSPLVMGVRYDCCRALHWKKQSSSSEPKITRCWCVNSNLGFGRFPGRSDGFTASEAGDVLLFLFSGLENLYEESKLAT